MYFLGFANLAVAVVSRILFNGMAFGFDYHLYQPDGALYTFMALRYSGETTDSAANLVIDWYLENAKSGIVITPDFFDPTTNKALWALVGVRTVYPVLSLPFVTLLGIPGMLAIPILSLGVLVWVILRIGARNNNQIVALVLVFLLTNSSTVTRWFIANLTDGLLAGIVAYALWILIRQGRFQVPLLIMSILLGSFTRFSLPIWISIASFLLLKRKQSLSFIVLITSVLAFLPTLFVRPDLGFVGTKPDQSIGERVIEFLWNTLKLIFVELAQLAAVDRSLLLILIVAFLVSIVRIHGDSSKAFLIISLGVLLIGAINPVLGVNFRYQLPLLVFAAWVILDNLQIRGYRTFWNVLNIKGDKSDYKLKTKEHEKGEEN